MQEVVKFNLKGLTGIIKRPESNVQYFTYMYIHKIAILGVLGAIIGENGYAYNALFKNKACELPEFYTNLCNLKIAVEPIAEKGMFSKNTISFNNSVGYASKEEGNNLIVKEEWLENPCWNIYILNDSSEYYLKIKEYLVNRKCEYIPYIGKNDHFANISEVEVFDNIKESENVENIDSIFTDKKYELINKYDMDDIFDDDSNCNYNIKEILPTKLDSDIGYDEFKQFTFTNMKLHIENSNDIYMINGKNIYFF